MEIQSQPAKYHGNIIQSKCCFYFLRVVVALFVLQIFAPKFADAAPAKKSAPKAVASSAAKPAAKAAAKTGAAQTSSAPPSGGTGLTGGGGEAKALEVRGQARSLQMMMLLKSKGDDIHFVKPRKDYRPEINATSY